MTVCPHRFIARATIEFDTGFRVGTGRADAGSDSGVVADANGLALIPGTGTAGVLREDLRTEFASAPTDRPGPNPDHPEEPEWFARFFGFQARGRAGADYPPGQGSRLTVTAAHVHDREDIPVEGLIDSATIAVDPILASALSPDVRDHVRLNRNGAVDHNGKFDERICPAGLRFTFGLELEGHIDRDSDPWNRLLSAIARGAFRLGGGQRRGYGRFHCVRLRARTFDLRSSDRDWKDFVGLPSRLGGGAKVLPDVLDDCASGSAGSAANSPARSLTIDLPVRPGGFWMFGGGEDPLGADLAPVRARRVCWEKGKEARLEECFLIPFSSIKGALRHRVAYHYNRRTKRFADGLTSQDLGCLDGLGHPAVQQLFGWASNHGNQDAGAPGCVRGVDLYLPVGSWQDRQQTIPHAAIDPFTGGTLSGALFDERPFWQAGTKAPFPGLQLELTDPTVLERDPILAASLADTLRDVARGDLALGGGGGRGLGRFEIAADPEKRGEVLDRSLAPLDHLASGTARTSMAVDETTL